jgi:putative membrane protein
MRSLALVLIGLNALIHLYILVLESFLWRTPAGRKRFRMSEEKAEMTWVMAANQGLYNGFLAAGLVWALVSPPEQLLPRATFFLACIAIAGVVGAATAMKTILYIQTVPAVLALAALWASR